jgi:hypothetical protein
MPPKKCTPNIGTITGILLKDNIAYQDKTSTMRMEENGKMSTGKMTKHINIRYFFCT